ncbi:MAG TPA: hypothetical protein VGC39_09260 [Candidatus Methylacidiphilales bacterium]
MARDSTDGAVAAAAEVMAGMVAVEECTVAACTAVTAAVMEVGTAVATVEVMVVADMAAVTVVADMAATNNS